MAAALIGLAASPRAPRYCDIPQSLGMQGGGGSRRTTWSICKNGSLVKNCTSICLVLRWLLALRLADATARVQAVARLDSQSYWFRICRPSLAAALAYPWPGSLLHVVRLLVVAFREIPLVSHGVPGRVSAF